ncbi:MAG: helix-turn-helix domain-containing protein [Gemmataceae bacterium]
MSSETLDRPVIDAAEASLKLGVSCGTVYKLIRQGKIEGYAVGRRRKIYADSIDSYQLRNAFGKTGLAAAPQELAAPKPRRRKSPVKALELPARRYLR